MHDGPPYANGHLHIGMPRQLYGTPLLKLTVQVTP